MVYRAWSDKKRIIGRALFRYSVSDIPKDKPFEKTISFKTYAHQTSKAFPQVEGGGANLLFAVCDFLTQHICSDSGFPLTARCASDNFDHKDFYKDRALLKNEAFWNIRTLFRGIDGKLANRSFLLSVTSAKK